MYPNAHIIHTTRSEASWIASMNKTLWAGQKSRRASSEPPRPMAELADVYWRVYWDDDFDRTGVARWREHERQMEELRKEIEAMEEKGGGSGRKWLEFGLGNGWEELCGLFGMEVPRGEDGEVLPRPNNDDARLNQKHAVGGETEAQKAEPTKAEAETGTSKA